MLDVALGDLLAEPSLLDWTSETGLETVPALRSALMDYRGITALGAGGMDVEPPNLAELRSETGGLWEAYQGSRFGLVTGRLPALLKHAQAAVYEFEGKEQEDARHLLGLTYQLAATQLTKLGETDLAWIAAERGLSAVRPTGDPVITGSLFRSVGHALNSTGRYKDAVRLTNDAAGYLDQYMGAATPELLSVYGTLLLAGSVAAARASDAETARTFLATADDAARRLGRDANHLWTAFGPTNVAVHRVAAAGGLGDIQVAIDLGPRVDTAAMPMERRVRHALEVSRAYSSWNRQEEALTTLLHAEQMAPEQVRYHYLGRQLVLTWIRQQRTKPSSALVGLARRLQVLD